MFLEARVSLLVRVRLFPGGARSRQNHRNMSMRETTTSRAVWWIWGVVAVLALATPVLSFLGRSINNPTDASFAIFVAVIGAGAFAPVGALIVSRRGNPVGWTLLAIGSGFVLSMFGAHRIL